MPTPDDPPTIDSSADDDAEVSAVEQRGCTIDTEAHGQRLDKVLVGLVPELSRSYLQRLIERGHVQLDGQATSVASRRVKAGQALQVELIPSDESQAYRPQPMALAVLYEDEHLLVIDKPAGLVVHPAPGNWTGTLLNGLLARDPAAAALPRAGIVHRLDKDTSGVMMVGRSLPAVTALVRDLAARDVQRQYLALAWGDVGAAPLQIDAPIGRDPASRLRMAVLGSGKPARTDVRRVAYAQGASAVHCKLHSGRTHQIRVHLASRGHALVADALYGGRPGLGLQRQALHAARLSLAHPITRQALRFDSPMPPDLAAAWRSVADATPVPWTDA